MIPAEQAREALVKLIDVFKLRPDILGMCGPEEHAAIQQACLAGVALSALAPAADEPKEQAKEALVEIVASQLRELFGPSPIESPFGYDALVIANTIVRTIGATAPSPAADEVRPELVWRICPYMGNRDGADDGEAACHKCPPSETFMGRENCTRGCYLLAKEVINIVQTGDPHRKGAVNKTADEVRLKVRWDAGSNLEWLYLGLLRIGYIQSSLDGKEWMAFSEAMKPIRTFHPTRDAARAALLEKVTG